MSERSKHPPTGRVIEGTMNVKGNPAHFSNLGAPGPLVEDTSVVGGTDAETGAPVIRPRTPSGGADESVRPTDAREGGS